MTDPTKPPPTAEEVGAQLLVLVPLQEVACTVPCPVCRGSRHHPTRPRETWHCILCNNTDEIPAAIAVEYALLGLDSIRRWRTWDRWKNSVNELLARHGYADR